MPAPRSTEKFTKTFTSKAGGIAKGRGVIILIVLLANLVIIFPYATPTHDQVESPLGRRGAFRRVFGVET